MEEKQVSVKDLSVHYKAFGRGKPFLILHGWGSKSDKWEEVANILSQKYLVIVPDLPGFGQSGQPKEAWKIDSYVGWLKEFCDLVPELQESFYLLGHSFGGAVAAKFSVKYNQKVEKLFLVAAACVRARTWIKKFYYGISKIIKLFSFLPGYQLFRKAFYKFVIRRSDYLYVAGVMQESYLRVISEDLSFYVSFVKVPTILIWGDRDESTPLDQGKFLHSRISRSKLVIVPGASHPIEIEMPVVLAEKITENLSD